MSAKRIKEHKALKLAVAAVGLAGWAATAAATTYTWTRGAGNNNWDNALNWTSADGTPPPPSDPLPEGAVTDLVFSGTMAVPGNTSSLRMPYTINSITFDSDFAASGSFGISSAALTGQTSVDLTLGAGGLTVHNFNQNVNVNAVTLAGETGDFKLSADQTWNIDVPAPASGAKTVGIFRPLVGSVTLTKIGTGILILSKANTDWSGNIVLDEGSIRTGGDGAAQSNHFGTGTLIHESANDVSITASTVSNDTLGGASGGGERTFSNNFRLGGTGQFTFGGSFAIHTTSASTITLTAADTRIAMANGSGNNTYNFAAKFTGTGGFVKLGGGTLNMTNVANDYAGATTFSGGTVVVSDPHQLGDGSATNNLGFDGGTLQMTAPMSMTRSITSNGGGTIDTGANDVTISGGMTQAGTGVLHKAGSGTLTLANVRAGGVAVDEGKIFVTANGGNGGVSKVGSVATAGTLDLNDNDLIVDYAAADPDPTDGLRLQLKAGRDSAWAGPGIVSKAAKDNAAGTTAIGYASAADVLGLTGADTATWGGQTVDASSVLMKYTYYGDANLDGKVTRDDLALADRGVAKALTGWSNGDFDYDGTAGTATDYMLMDKAFAANGGVLSADLLAEREGQFGAGYVSGLVASVPEPATLGAILAAASVVVTGRRRRNN